MIRLFAFLLVLPMLPAVAQNPSPGSAPIADRWQAATFFAHGTLPAPFSFKYNGKASADFLSTWQEQQTTRNLDANRTQQTLTFTESASGLQVQCVGVQYHDFPAIEWTLHFKNTGTADTAMIEDVQAIDTMFPVSANVNTNQLHYFNGAQAADNDYQPFTSRLGTPQSFTPNGRGSDRWLPYFNLDGGSQGVILAMGWPGQWKLDFKGDAASGWSVRGGLELTHFVLHPGEEVRSPLIALLFWQGNDWIDGQNQWRHWMLAHGTPQRDGKPLPPQLNACSSHQLGEMIHANEANQKQFIDGYLNNGIKIDYWWMDAGWYVNNGSWQNVGTWEVDKKRFPNGLRAVSDYAHSKGVKTIVWFEPQRVTDGTWLAVNHPEWLLGHPGDNRLLNLGNPDALAWLIDHISQMITDEGIDLYRQDFNMNPLGYWRANDAPDRQGITEMKDVAGYLAYWDGLIAHHPGLLIDSCASGGRRNDLETMRRSVPLLRSDDIMQPLPQESHTYGATFWLPYQGTGADGTTAYTVRSCTPWSITACYDTRSTDLPYPAIKKLYDQWREAAPLFLADYYPLTPYTLADTDWIAWQFNDPQAGKGVIQAFRRPKCATDSLTVKLRGLDAAATYELTNIDTGNADRFTGAQLIQDGYKITSPDQPGAPLIQYAKVQ
jgi:alpha-galactosidase